MQIKRYSNNNLIAVIIGDVTSWFSYDTLVAFEIKNSLSISENVWSNTTGKHLNLINGNKKIRISNEQFNKRVKSLKVTGMLSSS